ncbi:MAG: hypothetical protein N3A62_01325 [Thermodesulfovibrionales bacterium]|nr:hypothetical protein [Thermodesulfovibrionales bacterium]
MNKRLIDILRVLAQNLIERGYEADESINIDIDFVLLKEDLLTMELLRQIDEAELDNIKALLAYLLIKETELDIEDIYTFTFGMGRQIVWN